MQDLGVCWEARSFACQEVPASSPWHSAAGLWSKDKPRDRKGGISQRYFQIDPQESCRFVTGRRRFGLYPIQVCWWCNPSLSGHGLQPFLPGGGGVPCRTRAGIQCSGCKSHPRAAPLTSKPCEIAGPGQPPPWPAFAGWAGLSHGLGVGQAPSFGRESHAGGRESHAGGGEIAQVRERGDPGSE